LANELGLAGAHYMGWLFRNNLYVWSGSIRRSTICWSRKYFKILLQKPHNILYMLN